MAILNWPQSIVPASVAWHLQANSASFESPLTRATQTTELAGARWVADLVLPTLKGADVRAWTVFLHSLRGMAGRAYVPPWHAGGVSVPVYPAGSGPTADWTTLRADTTTLTADNAYPTTLGTPVVDGAGQSGAALATRGWTPCTEAARAGDYFSYDTSAGRTLHMVVANVTADRNGRAVLPVEPPLRTAPADAAPLEIANPTCIMRLKDDDSGAPSFSPGRFMTSSVALVEVF